MLNKLIRFLFLLIVVSCSNNNYESLIKKADDSFMNGSYKKAYKLYSKACKKNKLELYPKISRAESYYMGKWKSNKVYSKTCELYGQCFDLVNNSKETFLSEAYFMQRYNKYVFAIVCLDSLESKHGAYYPAKILRAEILYGIRDVENAEKEINKAIAIAPDKSLAYLKKGEFEFDNEMWKQAKDDLITYYRLCQDRTKYRGAYRLVLSYSKLGQADSACYYYKAYKHMLQDFEKWHPEIVSKCN